MNYGEIIEIILIISISKLICESISMYLFFRSISPRRYRNLSYQEKLYLSPVIDEDRDLLEKRLIIMLLTSEFIILGEENFRRSTRDYSEARAKYILEKEGSLQDYADKEIETCFRRHSSYKGEELKEKIRDFKNILKAEGYL